MQGVHVFANASGGPMLRRSAAATTTSSSGPPDGWRIAGWTFTLQWATGNTYIISLAAEPAGGSRGVAAPLYSAIVSPEPPSSSGKSLSLGRPSFIGSTVDS